MPIILLVLGVLLMVWGGFVLVTGDFVATLDIAASLIASGVGVIAIGSVVAALNKIARHLEGRPQVQPAMSAQPATQEQRRPQAAPAAPPPPAAPSPPAVRPSMPEGPSVVREGDIEGHHYRFYSDGSIEAEGPSGARRYRSIEEAREQILRERNERERPPAPPPVVPRSRVPPPPPPAPPRAKPRDPAGWERHLPPAHESEPDPYAPPSVKHAGDNGPDDEEWSEPFRMLLRGEQDPSGIPPKQGKR